MKIQLGKALLIIFITATLISSVILSTQSFTGYIVAEKANETKNITSLILFLSGLFGSIIYLSKFR